MHNLFRFLQRYHLLLLFLLLETIAFSMLMRSNTYHRSAAFNLTNSTTGWIYNIHKSVTDYFYLQQANQLLADENARLRMQLHNISQKSDSLTVKTADTVFTFMQARVVSNSVHFRNNYIIINKGSNQGVQKDMGLISSEGVAGIITGVSPKYATAISLLHKFAVISVRFKNSGQLANLSWQGGDYRYGLIDHIPTHLVLKKGDTLVTSGHSHLFPPGILVGTVAEFIPAKNEALNQAHIAYFTDFNKLRQVYVVKNHELAEIDSLINIRPHE
ncbi:MAG: rod shape-determining protein MreC [Bacteroidetes bacterium]|nr:rod shape-determining protein MreC [Bacteroidota bacterium]MBU1578866.1 rod shape-determining protein MreC [Bacteroidota bacterium]MBU2464731.1 rod shape-determining protein MreC [Bacteroidota bacterium]MBU2558711.1 rod shape-determining protein MreC [Bacteroidota bacterium]